MAVISFKPGELGARLRSDAKGTPKALVKAMKSAAHAGRALLISDSPVYRGILKNAWKVVAFVDGVELVNDQPYAGVIERGARPFKISPEGFEALKLWVSRKLLAGGNTWKWYRSEAKARSKADRRSARKRMGPTRKMRVVAEQMADKEASRIAWAIARKWSRVGMQGKYFVRRNLPQLSHAMDKEVTRFLSEFFNRGK